METLIDLGTVNLFKTWGNTKGKKSDCHAYATLNLQFCGSEQMRLQIEAFVYNVETYDCIIGGNYMDELAKTDLKKTNNFTVLYDLYQKYNNKIITAGHPEQLALLYSAIANHELVSLSPAHIQEIKDYLTTHNMLDITLPDGTQYHYANGWIASDNKPLEPDDKQTIINLLESQNT